MSMKANTIVDIVAFFVFLISAFSGFVLLGDVSFGLARHDWKGIHNISSIIFVILVVIHLVLHWRWVKNIPKILRGG